MVSAVPDCSVSEGKEGPFRGGPENRPLKKEEKRFGSNKCDICSWDRMVIFH